MRFLPIITLLSTLAVGIFADPQNKIHINGADDYCMFLPTVDHTDIGVSEAPGGARSYCTHPRGNQGQVRLFRTFFEAFQVPRKTDSLMNVPLKSAQQFLEGRDVCSSGERRIRVRSVDGVHQH